MLYQALAGVWPPDLAPDDEPGMNTGILLSGFPPELNQVVKAVVVLCVLIVQSPRFITIIKGMRGHDKT
jgi:simple sugar transport system permease protein